MWVGAFVLALHHYYTSNTGFRESAKRSFFDYQVGEVRQPTQNKQQKNSAENLWKRHIGVCKNLDDLNLPGDMVLGKAFKSNIWISGSRDAIQKKVVRLCLSGGRPGCKVSPWLMLGCSTVP